jgi:hypothetical protein
MGVFIAMTCLKHVNFNLFTNTVNQISGASFKISLFVKMKT